MSGNTRRGTAGAATADSERGVRNGSDGVSVDEALNGSLGGPLGGDATEALAGERSRPGRSADYAIDIQELTKAFQRRSGAQRNGYTTLKSAILGLFRPVKDSAAGTVTTAVHDLTLRIPRGASVGIIGRNGSGKSTLLKLITGIYKADSGTVKVNGRLAALIELGAGFHPDFTGRENLYLGGAMHGLERREVDRLLPDIVHFAELDHVIDDPVRTYSSGMFMRLGFSLAVHTNPDVLLVDEVLAVGDATFVNKCKERIAQLRREGKTLLLVTHDLDAVERWCDEALWIEKGRVRERGSPRRVIDAYRQFVEAGEELELSEQQPSAAGVEAVAAAEDAPAGDRGPERWGSREIEITGVRLVGSDGGERLVFHPDDSVSIHIRYAVREAHEDVVFGIGIHRSDGVVVYGTNTDLDGVPLPPLGERGEVVCAIDRLGLLDGRYTLDVAAHRSDGYPYDYHKRVLEYAVRCAESDVGVFRPPHRWEIREG